MNPFKILLPACVLFLAACNNSAEPKTTAEEKSAAANAVQLPQNFYKKLKGKIGDDFFITVDIIKRWDSLANGNSITGHYYYDKVGMPLTLIGTMSDSLSFELKEVNNQGEYTGIFKGKFINENELKGTWINPKTKKEYPFELKTVEENLAFNFSEYYNQNCKSREICLKSNKKDTLNYSDTMCASIHVSYEYLQGNDKVSKKINACLLRNLLSMTIGEKPEGSIMQLLHSIDNYGVGDVMEGDYSSSIVSNEGNILCMEVGGWANTGGAHGNGYSFYLNFDKRTGDTISLLDIVKPETIDELVARGKQQFIKDYGALGKDSEWFFGDEFVMPRTFSIGKGGLLFQYNSYEAGPYAVGAPSFFLSWKQIRDIVREEYLK